MQRLRQSSNVPPGGWRCVVPETGKLLKAASKDRLLEAYEAELRANGITLPVDLDAALQDAICKSQPPNSGACTDDAGNEFSVHLSLGDVARFMRTLLIWFFKGVNFADQEEAERRAAICVACPAQADVAGCFSCKGIGPMVRLLNAGRATSRDGELKTCRVCRCFNRTQVWFPLDVLHKASGDLDYAKENPNCWKIV